MAKRQKYIDGAIFKIDLKNGRYSFGRIMQDYTVCIYDIYTDQVSIDVIGIETLINLPKLFCISIYQDLIKSGIFEVVAFKDVSEKELSAIPPYFMQDIGNINDCELHYADDTVRKCKKEDCIGLERVCLWGDQGLIERVIDHYEGRENPTVEQIRVKLK